MIIFKNDSGEAKIVSLLTTTLPPGHKIELVRSTHWSAAGEVISDWKNPAYKHDKLPGMALRTKS